MPTYFRNFGCVRRRAGDALDWFDKNQLAASESHFARCERVFFAELESVNEGYTDEISETTVWWSFPRLLMKKTRKRYSPSQSLKGILRWACAAFGDIEFEVMEVHVVQPAAFCQFTGLAVSPLRVLPFHDSAKPSIWTVDNHRRG